jgi:hypothetical protein
VLRFSLFAPQTGVFHQRKVKKSHRLSNRQVFAGVLFADRPVRRSPVETLDARRQLHDRGHFGLTAPSLAGSADGDLPGVGTFSYCGTPILAPAPEVVAALGH